MGGQEAGDHGLALPQGQAPGQSHFRRHAVWAGLPARDAAARSAPDGWVLASDIAEGMLAEGARRTAAEGKADALTFAAADAEHLCLPDASFDRVLAGLALFMFPHAQQALAEMRRVLRPGGRIALSVWGPREAVPLIARAQDCIARLLPPPKVPKSLIIPPEKRNA